jgi:Arc/MetJ-type ribon-helix-helix transcriptional regulator
MRRLVDAGLFRKSSSVVEEGLRMLLDRYWQESYRNAPTVGTEHATIVISDELVEKIDTLIRVGIFRSRSHAVDAALELVTEKFEEDLNAFERDVDALRGQRVDSGSGSGQESRP